jgi:repressor LexA
MLTQKQYELLMFINDRLNQGGVSPSFDEMKDALGLRSKSGIHRLITALVERGFIRRLPHRARALEILRVPGVAERSRLVEVESEARSDPEAETGIESGDSLEGAKAVVSLHPADGSGMGAVRATSAEAASTLRAASPGKFQPNVIKGDFSPSLVGREVAGNAPALALPYYGRIAAGLPIEALRDPSVCFDVPASLLGPGEHYALEVAGDSMVEAGILDGDTVIIRRGEMAENGEIVVALVDNAEVTLKRMRRKGHTIALEPANPNYETRIFGADRIKVQGRLVGLFRNYR